MFGNLPAAVRFLILFAVAVALLLFALAYNVGGIAHENKAKKRIDLLNANLNSLQREYDKCHDRLDREGRGEQLSVNESTEFYQNMQAEKTRQRQNSMQLVHDAHDELNECQRQQMREREEHTGTVDENATQVILRLQYEVHALLSERGIIDASKENVRNELSRIIRAYQIENQELERRLKDLGRDKDVPDSELINELMRPRPRPKPSSAPPTGTAPPISAPPAATTTAAASTTASPGAASTTTTAAPAGPTTSTAAGPATTTTVSGATTSTTAAPVTTTTAAAAAGTTTATTTVAAPATTTVTIASLSA